MMDDPLPPPDQEPPPLPLPKAGAKRRWPAALLLVLAAGAIALYIGPLRIEVRFHDDAGRVPSPFEATLRSGSKEKRVTVEDGRLNLWRGRWNELEITDTNYVLSRHPVSAGTMTVAIERNSLLKLRQAATGQPSIPQRGDPDPQAE